MTYRLILAAFLLYLSPISVAGDIIIIPGSGLNDATSTAPVGGNSGTTLGQQRLNVFQKAADTLEAYLQIDFEVTVDAAFVTDLDCNSDNAILGTAGPNNVLINFANAPAADTYYPVALVNNLVGSDTITGTADIGASFNARLDNNANCLSGSDWYYGYDDPEASGDPQYIHDISFYSTVIHELLHGLGVLSFVDGNSGALLDNTPDGYTKHLFDSTLGLSWEDMTNSQRLTSSKNTDNLVWSGSNVNTAAAEIGLNDGVNNSQVEMHAPNPYEDGSSVSHFSIDASPNEIMEPEYTEFLIAPGLAQQVLQDIGWPIINGPIISEPPANTAPVLTAIGNQSSDEDNDMIISLSATDPDNQTISYSASSDNPSVLASISGTVLTLSPAENYFGNATITVIANDGSGAENATDSEVFPYTIQPVNDAPVFTNQVSASPLYSQTFTLNLTATDIEQDTLTFAVSAFDASQVTATVNNTILTVQAVNNFTGNTPINISVTDGDATTLQAINLTILKDFSLTSDVGNLNQDQALPILNTVFEFALDGGDQNHTVEVTFDGRNATQEFLRHIPDGKYYLDMPASGAFAGRYSITVTDSLGNSADFIIQRALRVSANITELIEDSTRQEILIEGAPADSLLDLTINQGQGLLDLKVNNVIATQVTTPDDAMHFNRAVVQLEVTDASNISAINISADSPSLPAGSVDLTTLPFHDVVTTVTNASGMGISATISINDDRFIDWGLSRELVTNTQGEATISLPQVGDSQITVSAEHHASLTTDIKPQSDQETFALELIDNPLTFSGRITTSTFDFSALLPSVKLVASDSSTAVAQLSNIRERSLNYTVTINKYAFDAVKLQVTLDDNLKEFQLEDDPFDAIINFEIEQAVKSDEPATDTDNSTAAGNTFILLILSCMIIFCTGGDRRRRQSIISNS
jgi:hypothetical protein